MKFILVCLLGCMSIPAMAQQDVNIFAENNGKGYILYAGNSAYCPVSIILELKMDNLDFSKEGQKIFVIPGRTDKMQIGEMSIHDASKGNKYSYKYELQYGDITISAYDTAYAYTLPYQTGKSFSIYQGYNGTSTHQNEKALDFSMTIGTEILAARDGIIVKVVQDNTESCPQESCKKFNNYLLIYHRDGTFANYGHIKYHGATVKPGDTVKAGELIAYSGNTGWSSGPHLHFACSLPGNGRSRTFATYFKTGDGTKTEILQENNSYLKEYK